MCHLLLASDGLREEGALPSQPFTAASHKAQKAGLSPSSVSALELACSDLQEPACTTRLHQLLSTKALQERKEVITFILLIYIKLYSALYFIRTSLYTCCPSDYVTSYVLCSYNCPPIFIQAVLSPFTFNLFTHFHLFTLNKPTLMISSAFLPSQFLVY